MLSTLINRDKRVHKVIKIKKPMYQFPGQEEIKIKGKLFSMAEHMEQQQEQEPATSTLTSYILFLKIMSKRGTWVCLFVLVYAILLFSTWNLLKSILSWYKLQAQPSSASSVWPALYASVLLGAVFGLISMAAALAVAVPASLVIWITVVVLLAFCGKPRSSLVIEGRKITREIVGFVFKILLKEGNLVAAVCAVLGYFTLFRRNRGDCDVE